MTTSEVNAFEADQVAAVFSDGIGGVESVETSSGSYFQVQSGFNGANVYIVAERL